MPITYKTADKLKRKILYTAGQYFQQYGYDKTTYQIIADKLGISKAAIAYHFKTKPWIIYKLFEDYTTVVYSYVKENIEDGYNCFKFHCTANLIINRLILKHRRNTELYLHKEHIGIWEDECIYLIEALFREIAKDFKKESDDNEIHSMAVMYLGAKMGLIREYAKHSDKININDQCRYMLYLIGTLSKLDEATIQRNIDYAFNFTEIHNPPASELLG